MSTITRIQDLRLNYIKSNEYSQDIDDIWRYFKYSSGNYNDAFYKEVYSKKYKDYERFKTIQ